MAEREPKRSILLVEDNPLDARSLLNAADKLELGTAIRLVSDGQAAIDHLRAERPIGAGTGLVLLDLNLPGKDGHDVLAEIRADAVLGLLPVVVLSTSSAAADIARAYQLGANAYVMKPSNLDDWVDVLSSISSFWLRAVVLPS